MGQRRAPPDGSPYNATSGDIHESVEEMRNLLLDLRAEVRNQAAPKGPPALSLAELAAAWLPRKLRTISAPETFEGRVRLHLVPILGAHTYATLKKRDVEDLLHHLTTRERGRLSEQTANHVRDAGRQLVQDAIDNGEWLGPNPFAQADKLEIPDADVDVLTRPEAARLLRWGVPRRWRSLFALALYLGPRRGTIFHIEKEHVHLSERLIDFHVTKQGKKQLGVPIPDELLPHLEEAYAATTGRWLFCRDGGLQLSPKSHVLNDALAEGLERSEITRKGRKLVLTFHGLRRVSSCLHQEAGCHPWVVSKVLGHSQASLAMMGSPTENMTARKYTRFTEEFVRAQLNRLSLKLS